MAPIPPVKVPRKRQGLAGIIERGNSEEISALIEEVDTLLAGADGYRYTSQFTQGRQDRHLALYRAVVKRLHGKEITLSDEDTDKLGFPEDHKVLLI